MPRAHKFTQAPSSISRLLILIRIYDIGISRHLSDMADSMSTIGATINQWHTFQTHLETVLTLMRQSQPVDEYLATFSRKDDTP